MSLLQSSLHHCPILKVTDMLNTWQKAHHEIYSRMCSRTYRFELKLTGLSIEQLSVVTPDLIHLFLYRRILQDKRNENRKTIKKSNIQSYLFFHATLLQLHLRQQSAQTETACISVVPNKIQVPKFSLLYLSGAQFLQN